jgi:hypothetical protein
LEIDSEYKKAQTVKKNQGERIYDRIIGKRIDPALLIKSGNGKYKLNVFPFLKHQKRKVIIEYYSVLESETYSFLYGIFP